MPFLTITSNSALTPSYEKLLPAIESEEISISVGNFVSLPLRFPRRKFYGAGGGSQLGALML